MERLNLIERDNERRNLRVAAGILAAIGDSRYPPAKPGALGFEPLKAPWGGAAYAGRPLIPKAPMRQYLAS